MPRRSWRRLAGAVLALALRAPRPAAAQAPTRATPNVGEPDDSALGAALDSLVRAELARTGAPGAQVTVRWKGRPLVERGYGLADVARRTPMTTATSLPVGSITKTFTGAAVLLRADGVAAGGAAGRGLRLDDPVARFFPGRDLDPRPTLRHLLSHTSGLAPYETLIPNVGAFARTAIRPDTVLSYVAGAPLQFDPGTRWAYSNTNYHLLGLVLERAAGRGYFDVLAADVLPRAGLRATGSCEARGTAARRATGYERERAGLEVSTPPRVALSFAAGGLCSTTAELARWLERLPRVLGAERFAAMSAPTRLGDGGRHPYGLGLVTGEIGRHEWYGHGGSLPGFDAFAARYPDDDLVIVVAANLRPFDTEALHARIARRVLGVAAPTVADVSLPAERRREYAGTYAVNGRSLRIVESGDRLGVVGPGDFTLAFQGDDAFVAREEPEVRLQFVREGGRVVGLLWTAPGRRIELRKAPASP